MSAPTNKVQILEHNGRPAFAVIPYDDYLVLTGTPERTTVPHEVVGMVVKNNWNLVKAWRKYLGISQKDLASIAGVSQSAISQMERSSNLRDATIEKLAAALGLDPELLID